MMRTLFFGSSSYSLPLVVSLHKNTQLVGVITRPDASFGRNKDISPSPIKAYAKSNQIPFFTPKDREELICLYDSINGLNSDIAVVADYGLIIPEKIFNLPKFGTLNVHFGKLPQYRGASPLQWTIANGEKDIPISIIRMDKGLDTGDLITEIGYQTNGDETTGELYSKLFGIASDHLPRVITDYTSNTLKPHRQENNNITVTKQLERGDGFIPWDLFISSINHKSQTTNHDLSSLSPIARSALSHSDRISLSIFNLYRALSPWPGLWTIFPVHKKRLKILKMSLSSSTSDLTPESVQLEGKKPVSWKQFSEAYLPLNQPDKK